MTGGQKYQGDENFKEKVKLKDILVSHDAEAFIEFVNSSSDEAFSKIKEAGDLQDPARVSRLMHSLKSQMLYLGEECVKSRNELRKLDFGYTHEETRLCSSCKWFREAPEGEEFSCMHLGSLPTDIICPGYHLVQS